MARIKSGERVSKRCRLKTANGKSYNKSKYSNALSKRTCIPTTRIDGDTVASTFIQSEAVETK